jgi:hypothetical protein
MLRRVAFVRTDVSEELSASFIRVTRIGELGTTLAVATEARCEAIFTWWFVYEVCTQSPMGLICVSGGFISLMMETGD